MRFITASLRVIGFILAGVGVFWLRGPAFSLADISLSIAMTTLGFVLLYVAQKLHPEDKKAPGE